MTLQFSAQLFGICENRQNKKNAIKTELMHANTFGCEFKPLGTFLCFTILDKFPWMRQAVVNQEVVFIRS